MNDLTADKPKTDLDLLDLDLIVHRIASGEYQSHIAKELGIAPQRLHERVSKHPAYRDALLARNIAKLDSAQQGIEREDTALGADLARAREAFKAAAWRASRECRNEYGDGPQVAIQQNITIVHESA